MILCTGCGTRNQDENRFCAKCGRKLQSDYKPSDFDSDTGGPLPPFRHNGVAPDLKNDLKRMIEAWCYVVLLGGVAAGCYFYGEWWPMYPALLVLGAIVWLRGI